MSDGPALFRAVMKNPAENAARLVSPTGLDEHGEPDRAEFIRGQIRLSDSDPWDDGHTALAVRCRQLERSHPEWLGALADFAPRGERFCGPREHPFERGFPSRAKLTPAEFVKNRSLFNENPITRVEFKMDGRIGSAWVKRPAVAQLTGIEFSFLGTSARASEMLACLERARPLDHFGLTGFRPAVSAAEAALLSPAVAGVRSLCITGTPLPETTEAAIASAPWPNLRSLERWWVSDLDWLGAPWVGPLRELTVYDTEPNLTSAQKRLLADVLPETDIRVLRLGRWQLDVPGARTRGKAIARSRVRSLALATTSNRLTAVSALLTPKTLAEVRALYLSWAELDANTVGGLLGTGLRVCALDHMTCDALLGLARPPGLPELTELRLGLVWSDSGEPVGDRLRAVLDAGTLPRLVSLSLSETTPGFGTKVPHGDQLAVAVAACPAAERLRALCLHESVTRVGAAALADSPYLNNLQLLDASVWPKDADADRLLMNRFGAVLNSNIVGIEY